MPVFDQVAVAQVSSDGHRRGLDHAQPVLAQRASIAKQPYRGVRGGGAVSDHGSAHVVVRVRLVAEAASGTVDPDHARFVPVEQVGEQAIASV